MKEAFPELGGPKAKEKKDKERKEEEKEVDESEVYLHLKSYSFFFHLLASRFSSFLLLFLSFIENS